MSRIIICLSVLLPLPAGAHVGHLADVAGHDHWIALGAIGLAAAAALAAVLAGKDKDEKDDPEADANAEGEAEEAPA